MSAADDITLVSAARGGDAAAYGQLFERYHARIYNYAYGIVGNREDAGDIAQDAFVRVFEALPRLAGELNFSAYVYRTTHNLAINAVKHRSRFVPPDALDLQAEASLRADPERVALVKEQQDQAWAAAFHLTDNHRAILSLRELHDLSYDEIAQVMGMPRNTVGVLLSRARMKYKEAFRMSSIDTDNLVKECREMLPLLSALIDDELDAAKRTRVEAHLEECAFCRLALEEMTEASKSYRVIVPLIPAAAAKAAAWDRVRDVLNADPAQAASGGMAATGDTPVGLAAVRDPAPSEGGRPDDARMRSRRRLTRRILAIVGGAIVLVAAGAGLALFAPSLFGLGGDDVAQPVVVTGSTSTTALAAGAAATSTSSTDSTVAPAVSTTSSAASATTTTARPATTTTRRRTATTAASATTANSATATSTTRPATNATTTTVGYGRTTTTAFSPNRTTTTFRPGKITTTTGKKMPPRTTTTTYILF